MLKLKIILQYAFMNICYVLGGNGDISPLPMVGGDRDLNNCLTGAGFTWCEASNECIRRWETPCSDDYNNCNDCLLKQRGGMNIACPIECDTMTPMCNEDNDCGESGFCKGIGECELYLREGDTCGELVFSHMYEERCHPTLECVHSKSGYLPSMPIMANSRGLCKKLCKGDERRDEYGICINNDNKNTDNENNVNENNVPLLMGGYGDSNQCNRPCPPLPECPQPGPDCNYNNPSKDECGCTIGCGEINCIEPPIPPPIDHHICPEVMCMMYCENGYHIDENGCNLCSCNQVVAVDGDCIIPYGDCNGQYVCPKVTEVTHCSEGGIEGATTYRLSLVIREPYVKNIYALYGDNIEGGNPMNIPAAYQVFNTFGSNIGGTSEITNSLSPNSIYDSWLTIGITNGDPNDELGTIGIDFSSWDINNPLIINNGAVFKMNPDDDVNQNEIIIGQLTIPTRARAEAVINVQGKLKNSQNTWKQEKVRFSFVPPSNGITIPDNCEVWYDGCNTCRVSNGVIGICTRIMCLREDNPYCMRTIPGH